MDMHKASPAPVDFEGSSMYSSTTPAWRSMIVPLVLCVCVGCGDAQVPANRGFRRAALSEVWDGRQKRDAQLAKQ
ncbi:hypothetical protein V8C40DRAFT_236207, partial [Trichoderma camerunense]